MSGQRVPLPDIAKKILITEEEISEKVEELGSFHGGDDVSVGGLVSVAAVVVMGFEDVAEGDGLDESAGADVVAVDVGGAAGSEFAAAWELYDFGGDVGAPGPDQVADDEDVLPLVPEVADIFLGLGPLDLARVRIVSN